jgi:uncharacterized protein YhfF
VRPLELGRPGAQRSRLTALVLAGEKTGTAGLLAQHEAGGEPVEHVGERLALVDDHGAALAVVRVTSVAVVRLADVTDAFARSEGEGFAARAAWAEVHQRFWAAEGFPTDDDSAVVRVGLAVEPGTTAAAAGVPEA